MTLPPFEVVFEVVSDAEAERAAFVVCMREGSFTPFTDNVTGTCTHCGHGIFFRPHVPKKPPKICLECALDIARGGRA